MCVLGKLVAGLEPHQRRLTGRPLVLGDNRCPRDTMGGELLSHRHTERGSLHLTTWIFLHVVIFFQFCLCVSAKRLQIPLEAVRGSEGRAGNENGQFLSNRHAVLPPHSPCTLHTHQIAAEKCFSSTRG